MIIDCISDGRNKKQNCIVQFLELVDKIPINSNGCKIWTKGISKTGYGVYSILNFTYSVPRLLYNTLKDGLYKDGLVVRHKCDNRACCNIDHLEIGSQSENLMDASKRKRLRVGEENNKTFLKEYQVIEIRNLYPKKSTCELAKIYGTSAGNIRDALNGKTWKHLPGKQELNPYNRATGEKMGRSKLTEKQVLEIRRKYPEKSGIELAKEYGVCKQTIYNAINETTFVNASHVNERYKPVNKPVRIIL